MEIFVDLFIITKLQLISGKLHEELRNWKKFFVPLKVKAMEVQLFIFNNEVACFYISPET